MTDTPNTPELNPQDVQDEDDLDVVVMTDEDGTEYECAVKPFRASDKTLLNMLLNKKSA